MRTRLLVLAVTTAFALSACGSTTATPAPVVTVTKEVPAPVVDVPAPATNSDDEYISYINMLMPGMVSTYGETSLIEVGRQSCEFFQKGFTLNDFGQIAISSGLTVDETAAIAAAAVRAYCPEMETYVIS